MTAMRFSFPSGDGARYAAILVGLGGASLAIIINRVAIEQQTGIGLGILDYRLFPVAAFGLVTFGGAIIILWLIGLAFRHAVVRPFKLVAVKYDRLFRRFDNLTLSTCTFDDLAAISKLAATEFGVYAASLERNRALFATDDQSYWKITDGGERIVGFYCLFRLTAMGTRAVNRGEFDIVTCPTDYLRKDKKYRYVNIYIAGLFGESKKAQAMVLGALNRHGLEIRPKAMFARAASEDGLRLLEKAKFSPVHPQKIGLGTLYKK
jgi:hypothetical protein